MSISNHEEVLLTPAHHMLQCFFQKCTQSAEACSIGTIAAGLVGRATLARQTNGFLVR